MAVTSSRAGILIIEVIFFWAPQNRSYHNLGSTRSQNAGKRSPHVSTWGLFVFILTIKSMIEQEYIKTLYFHIVIKVILSPASSKKITIATFPWILSV